MRVPVVLVLLALMVPGLSAAGEPMGLFLGERVPLLPVDGKTPPEALPAVNFRAEGGDKNGVVVVMHCDARNLPGPAAAAEPFRVELRLGKAGPGEPKAVVLAGRGDSGLLEPVGEGKEAAADARITAKLEVRPEGIWRVVVAVPGSLVPAPAAGEDAPVLPVDVFWRLAGGAAAPGTVDFPDKAALRLGAGEGLARLLVRAPRPTDVVAMLQAYAEAADPTCVARCLTRILRICRRDDGLRGALAMALEHDDPKLRQAAARVWQEWPDDGSDGLEPLKAKAKAVLGGKGKK